MRPTRPDQQIAQLRAWRTAPAPDLSLRANLGHMAQQLRRDGRQFGDLGVAVFELIPADVREHVALGSVARGVLTLYAADSATLAELRRWLKTGGEMAIVKRSPSTLTRVAVKLRSKRDAQPPADA